MPESALSPSEVELVREAVLAFYRQERRGFPWRHGTDAYGVLVSEVMLQQTRADTVVPYFERWMARFPTLQELAKAETEEVLRYWQGLGYYRRAGNLLRAVREVASRYDGAIPREPSELRTLPGVGAYTAGAVASIAFGVPTPAVDGNVKRVLCRLMDAPRPQPRTLQSWAAELVDPSDPGSFNQGLMELGARICVPRGPSCSICPLAEWCRGRSAGTQEKCPAPRARRAPARISEAVVALVRGSRSQPEILMRRRPEEGLLGGMWELPGAPVRKSADPEGVARALALKLIPGVPHLVRALEPLDHTFTHRRVRYLPFLFAVPASTAGPSEKGRGGPRWVVGREEDDLPMSVAQRRILRRLRAENLWTPAR